MTMTILIMTMIMMYFVVNLIMASMLTGRKVKKDSYDDEIADGI